MKILQLLALSLAKTTFGGVHGVLLSSKQDSLQKGFPSNLVTNGESQSLD